MSTSITTSIRNLPNEVIDNISLYIPTAPAAAFFRYYYCNFEDSSSSMQSRVVFMISSRFWREWRVSQLSSHIKDPDTEDTDRSCIEQTMAAIQSISEESGIRSFYRVCEEGFDIQARLLLQSNPDLEAKINWRSLLYHAIHHGSAGIIPLCEENGCSFMPFTEDEYRLAYCGVANESLIDTPLVLYAIKKCSSAVIGPLIQAGANKTFSDRGDLCRLDDGEPWRKFKRHNEYIFYYNCDDCLLPLYQHEVQIATQHFGGFDGATPSLEKYCTLGDFNEVKSRLSGMTESEEVVRGCYAAAAQGHLSIVQLYIRSGFDPCGLRGACKNGHDEIVELLLNHGLDPDPSYLYAAAGNGHYKVVKRLLQHGMDPNGDEKRRPLSIAVREMHFGVVNLLLEKGADISLCSNGILAQGANNYMMTKTLLEAGADANAIIDAINAKVSILCSSIRDDNYDVTELLLNNGADPNFENNKDITPLHFALVYRHYKIARLLIRHGAHKTNFLKFLSDMKPWRYQGHWVWQYFGFGYLFLMLQLNRLFVGFQSFIKQSF